MKRIITILYLLVTISSTQAQFISMNYAQDVAQTWVQVINDKNGSWAGQQTASVQPGQEFRYNNLLIGYFFPVMPSGFIVINLRRAFSPVEAFDERSNLNPHMDKGLTLLIKERMYKVIEYLTINLGPLNTIPTATLLNNVNADYRQLWDNMDSYIPGTYHKRFQSEWDYFEGEILLSTFWDQHYPYNDDCPALGCATTTNTRALVGCVATAGAQIMKYWNWPPYGEGGIYADSYDWINMPDSVDATLNQTQVDALAELNYEVAESVNMNFGCDSSMANNSNIVNTFEIYYRYSNACNYIYRNDYTSSTWYSLIQAQLSVNRPIEYRVTGHAIVVDGWLSTFADFVHVNYGWGTGSTGWLKIDSLYLGDYDEESMARDIFPDVSLGDNLSGVYDVQTFPYRYFDREASGTNAHFNPGQFLQILPDISVSATSGNSDIRFNGNVINPVRIYTGGNTSKGAVIYNGSIRLTNGGSFELQ